MEIDQYARSTVAVIVIDDLWISLNTFDDG